MGFMDKAKEAAEDLKASFASNEVRDSEQTYRDLGMIAYLTTTGRPIDEADRQRLINTLWAIEQQGKLPAFRLATAAPPPPPPPPPVPQQHAAPPPPPPAAGPAPAARAPPPRPRPHRPRPPTARARRAAHARRTSAFRQRQPSPRPPEPRDEEKPPPL